MSAYVDGEEKLGIVQLQMGSDTVAQPMIKSFAIGWNWIVSLHVGGMIEPARDARRWVIKIDCDFFCGPIQRIAMSDGCIQTGNRGTACILDRFDSVTSVLACCAINFFYFYVEPGCWAVINHNEIASQEYLNLFLIFEDYCRVTQSWGISIEIVTSKCFYITDD